MAVKGRQERFGIAASYAKAVYELAAEQGREDQVRLQMEHLAGTLKSRPALSRFFASPVVTTVQHQDLLDQLAGQMDDLVRGVLAVMNRRKRLGLVEELVSAFFAEYDRQRSRIPTRVTTAVPVDEDQKVRIRDTLAVYLEGNPIIDYQVDRSIIGGFVARAGDVLIDGSVRAQLARITNALIARGEDEVQGG